jgi:RHS repeat-associated protein
LRSNKLSIIFASENQLVMVSHETYWSTITDCNGAVEQELSYDAWGNLRDPNTWIRLWSDPIYEEPMFDRGYTGHEHLYAFGLINMNGRCYDPMMSSFLSVDAYVQSPDNSQNFNRYAYCLNNPLKYTDPSGWVMVGGMTPSNPFHDNWGQNFGEKIYTMSSFSLLDFHHDVVQDILVAHQMKAVFRVGKLLVGDGGIKQIQRPLGVNLQCLGKHYDDVALFAPKYGVSHSSSSKLGE